MQKCHLVFQRQQHYSNKPTVHRASLYMEVATDLYCQSRKGFFKNRGKDGEVRRGKMLFGSPLAQMFCAAQCASPFLGKGSMCY